jgi:hypothetical protein
MMHLNYMAYSHLLHHELGHIVKCHIPFLRGNNHRSGSYAELPSIPLSSEECRIRRALELDADAAAFYVVYRSMKRRTEEGFFPGLTVDNFHEVWTSAILLLYSIMQFLSYKSGLAFAHSTHPSVEARLRFGLSYVAGDKVALQDDVMSLDRAATGIDELRNWWLRAGAPTYRLDRKTNPSDEAIATLGDLDQMRADLSKLSQERKARHLGSKAGC